VHVLLGRAGDAAQAEGTDGVFVDGSRVGYFHAQTARGDGFDLADVLAAAEGGEEVGEDLWGELRGGGCRGRRGGAQVCADLAGDVIGDGAEDDLQGVG
jgi:hypothetical protein